MLARFGLLVWRLEERGPLQHLKSIKHPQMVCVRRLLCYVACWSKQKEPDRPRNRLTLMNLCLWLAAFLSIDKSRKLPFVCVKAVRIINN